MPAVGTAQRGAERVRHNPALTGAARAGFIGYGLLHLAFAWLTVSVVRGRSDVSADQSGAFSLMLRRPGGRPLVVAVGVGLTAMALWQLLVAAVGHRDKTGGRRVAERLLSLVRTAVYGALAWTAARIVTGKPASSSSQQSQVAAGVMTHSWGRLLVGAVGVAVVAVGAGLMVYGARRSFEKRLHLSEMPRNVRQTMRRLGQIGYLAKGAAFAIVGVLLVDAAAIDNAARAAGLDAALHTLAGLAWGSVLLIVVALGFAAFGGYCFGQARYRKV
jgi:hypothetical protein